MLITGAGTSLITTGGVGAGAGGGVTNTVKLDRADQSPSTGDSDLTAQ